MIVNAEEARKISTKTKDDIVEREFNTICKTIEGHISYNISSGKFSFTIKVSMSYPTILEDRIKDKYTELGYNVDINPAGYSNDSLYEITISW